MTDLTLTGQTVRIIESTIGPVIPIVDIAEMIGYSRSAIDKVIGDYEGKMSPCKTFVTLQTSGGPQRFSCLNREGVDYLFVIIHPSKAKMNIDDLLEFRKSVLERMDGQTTAIVPVPVPALDIKAELRKAREYAEVCQCDAKVLQAAVFKKHGEPELADALNAPAITHGETGWYNPTGLVKLCNDPLLTAERLNWYLKNHGYQYRDGYIWRLTANGMEHGKEYIYTASSQHQEIRISWRESILYASGLKKILPESQTALAHG